MPLKVDPLVFCLGRVALPPPLPWPFGPPPRPAPPPPRRGRARRPRRRRPSGAWAEWGGRSFRDQVPAKTKPKSSPSIKSYIMYYYVLSESSWTYWTRIRSNETGHVIFIVQDWYWQVKKTLNTNWAKQTLFFENADVEDASCPMESCTGMARRAWE